MGLFGVGGFTGGKQGGPHYEIEVNEGSVNVNHWQKAANERVQNGYRMAHAFMQDRNTIVVWERVS